MHRHGPCLRDVPTFCLSEELRRSLSSSLDLRSSPADRGQHSHSRGALPGGAQNHVCVGDFHTIATSVPDRKQHRRGRVRLETQLSGEEHWLLSQSSVPGTHARWLSTTCYSSSKGLCHLSPLWAHAHNPHTDT